MCDLGRPCECFDGTHALIYPQGEPACRNCARLCDCRYIARIREDERNRIDRATPWAGGDK